MFSGIVENIGEITKIKDSKIYLKTPLLKEISIGQSVAHDGVCLTVSNVLADSYEVELMPETFAKSHFKQKKTGDFINLERSLKINDRLDGHLVQGHTDCVGTIVSIENIENSYLIKIKINSNYEKYLVNKGSITVNGVSLTVVNIKNNIFSVSIVPYTWKNTNFKFLKKADLVNIETDILAKYLVKWFKKDKK